MNEGSCVLIVISDLFRLFSLSWRVTIHVTGCHATTSPAGRQCDCFAARHSMVREGGYLGNTRSIAFSVATPLQKSPVNHTWTSMDQHR